MNARPSNQSNDELKSGFGRTQARRIDEICDRFESKDGERPIDDIDALLAEIPEGEEGETAALFRELLRVHVERRKRSGRDTLRPEIESRFQQFPEIIVEVFRESELENTVDQETEAGEFTDGTLSIPDSYGAYRLKRRIGSGGMGTVFLAEQLEPVQRTVAIKMLREKIQDRNLAARFELECQTLSMMNSPNIAKLYDAGTWHGRWPFFVMEWVPGMPLGKYCREMDLDLTTRLRLFHVICTAVQHAHNRGIIHRDLKPANILVAEYQEEPIPKVIDFGLAKTFSQLGRQRINTQHGQLIGTLQYMSPEQTSGSPLDVDARADVYALGVVLYELLVGSPPIDKNTIEEKGIPFLLEEIRTGKTPIPSQRLQADEHAIREACQALHVSSSHYLGLLRGELDWITMKALAKSRRDRYQTPIALADDVRRFLNGESITARPPSLTYRIRTLCRRHRVAAIALSSVAIFLILATVICACFAASEYRMRLDAEDAKYQAVLERKESQRQEGIARKSEASLASALEKNKEEHYLRDMITLQLAWNANQAQGIALDILEGNEIDDDLKEMEWHYWHRTIHGSHRVLNLHEAAITALCASKKRGLIAAASIRGRGRTERPESRIRITTLSEGQVLHEMKCQSIVSCAQFTPDDRHLVVGDTRGDVRIWDTSDGGLIQRFRAHEGRDFVFAGVRKIVFSSDGKTMFTAGGDGRLKIWEYASRKVLEDLRGATNYVAGLSLSPDNQRVAFTDDGGSTRSIFRVWDLQSRKTTHYVKSAASKRINDVSFMPDGQHLLVASQDGTVNMWHIESEEIVKEFLKEDLAVNQLAVSSDGSCFIGRLSDGQIRLVNIDSGKVVAIRGNSFPLCLDFSFDGQSFLTGGHDGVLRRWNTIPIQNPVSCQGDPVGAVAAEFTRDSRYLITADRDYKIRRWDTEDGSLVGEADNSEDKYLPRFLSISEDNQELITADSKEGVFRVWDVATLTLKERFGIIPMSSNVVTSADGSPLAVYGVDSMITLWDPATRKRIRDVRLHDDSVVAVAFSGSPTRVVSVDLSGQCLLWAEDSKMPIRQWKLDPDVRSVSMARDGSLFVYSAGFSGTVWSQKTESEEARPQIAGQEVFPINQGLMRVNENGRRLITCSRLGGVRVWDISTGDPVLNLTSKSPDVPFLCVSSDGYKIAAANREDKVMIWNTRPLKEGDD